MDTKSVAKIVEVERLVIEVVIMESKIWYFEIVTLAY